MPSQLQRASDAHRAAQARLAVVLTRLVAAAHRRSIAPDRLGDPIVQEWLAEMIPLVQAYRERSVTLSEGFYARARLLADPNAPALPFVGAEPLPDEAVATSLRVTGVIELVQSLNRGEDEAAAAQAARTAAEGAAVRQALGGGRSYLDTAYQRDRVDLLWYRITREGCCSWCAMQASRGAVFREDSWDASDARFAGEGDVKGHDSCRCTKGFVQRREPLPDAVKAYRDLWDSTTKGLSGREARSAFRREFESKFPRR